MSDSGPDPELTELLADLTRALQDLEREVEPERKLRPPTPSELSQFTSEVAIPAVILILRTNIKALQLLRRTIQMADGRRRGSSTAGTVDDVRSRAEQMGSATLSQLDTALGDLQSALEGRPADDDAQELLSEAQELRQEVEDELDAEEMDSDAVDIDVDAELRSIKDSIDDDNGENPSGSDGDADDDNDGQDGNNS